MFLWMEYFWIADSIQSLANSGYDKSSLHILEANAITAEYIPTRFLPIPTYAGLSYCKESFSGSLHPTLWSFLFWTCITKSEIIPVLSNILQQKLFWFRHKTFVEISGSFHGVSPGIWASALTNVFTLMFVTFYQHFVCTPIYLCNDNMRVKSHLFTTSVYFTR